MKHLLLTTLALLALAPPVCAQTKLPHGSTAELKGVRRIFIDADAKDRERMLKVFRKNAKKIPGVQVVDYPADAEVTLIYRVDEGGIFGKDVTQPLPNGTTISTGPNYEIRAFAFGYVMKWTRILMQYDTTKSTIMPSWPSEQFAKQFVEAWAKANK